MNYSVRTFAFLSTVITASVLVACGQQSSDNTRTASPPASQASNDSSALPPGIVPKAEPKTFVEGVAKINATPAFFKALADPNRVAILIHLAQSGEKKTVSDVSCCCPTDISVVSRHLGVLRDAGILEAQKSGRAVFYSVRMDQLTTLLRNLADALEACCPRGSCAQGRTEDEPEHET